MSGHGSQYLAMQNATLRPDLLIRKQRKCVCGYNCVC
jgi:hypothetical protein